ncbi:MAG: hypothetical protein GKS06_10650 [Acidobacteria bacterium]|nr:hypothetical protein [Acidobacteriota bacterium]
MSDRTRKALMIALLLLVPFAAACGAAEEPAPEAPAEEPAPAEEAAPVVDEPVEEEPEAPAEPQIVGNILLSGESFDWGEVTDDTQAYTWTVRVQNDTTSNLRITVFFDFLDGAEDQIKRETATITLAPASGRTITESGTMTYDEALTVEYSVADYDFELADS